MLKTNYFDRDVIQMRDEIQNIHHADPLPKDENFDVCTNHFEIDCFPRDLKARNFVSAYLTGILSA